MRRGPRVLATTLAAAVLALVLPAPAAEAHAYLETSNPADGATLAHAPRTLRLGFSEHVVLAATRITVTDGRGRSLPATGLRLLSGHTDIEEPATVVADLPALPREAYRISWETLSSDDLHRTAGIVVFGVGRPVTAGRVSESLPRPEEAALRWLVLLGLSGALGGALARQLLRGTGRARPFGEAGRRSALLSLGATVSAAGIAVVLLADQLGHGGLSLPALLGSGYPEPWLLREAGLLALALSAWPRLRATAPRSSRPLLVAGGTAACLGEALLGHAGASGDLLRVLTTTAHLAAATTWVGAVAVLTLTAALPGWRGVAGTEDVRALLRSFARPAGVCVSVMVVTGVLLASDVLGSVDAALRTFYGRAMLAKLALAAVAGALALANHLRVRGRRDLDAPRRSLAAEGLVAVALLAATAVLTSGQPATEPQLVRDPVAGSPGPVAGRVADLQEVVGLRPNRPGRSLAVVAVFDTRRPAPAPVRGVDVTLPGGLPTPATALDDGHWSAPVVLPRAGATRVTVTVHRPGLPDVTSTSAWTVAAGPRTTTPLVSDAPLAGPLRRTTGALAGLVALVWVVVAVRRRRSRSQSSHVPEEDYVSLIPFAPPSPHPLGAGAPTAAEVD